VVGSYNFLVGITAKGKIVEQIEGSRLLMSVERRRYLITYNN
jgi:hypothetical protein